MTMAFTVSAATNEDIRQIVHIMFKAYGGGNEYINAIFPRGLTEEGEDLTTQRMLRINSIAPGITWEKATDTTTGVVVGGAMWSLYEHVKPQRFPIDGPPGTWETAEEKEYAKALQASCVGDEMALCDGSDLPIMRMPIMAVDPFCQSKGAGTALLESGLRKADGLHAVTTLVATSAGKGLYAKHGFKVKSERDLAYPEKFGDRPKVHFWTMLRERVEK